MPTVWRGLGRGGDGERGNFAGEGGAAQNLSRGWSWEHPELGLCPSMAFW